MTRAARHSLIPTVTWPFTPEEEDPDGKRTLSWKPSATTRITRLPSYFLSLSFIPREHHITLVTVRTVEIMKTYSLQDNASPHCNWNDRTGLRFLRVRCQDSEAFSGSHPWLRTRITWEVACQTNGIADSRVGPRSASFIKLFRQFQCWVKVENQPPAGAQVGNGQTT